MPWRITADTGVNADTRKRRQLPPQTKRIELAQRSGGRPVVRYQLLADVGKVDGKRKRLRKRFVTEAEARQALGEVLGTSRRAPS